MPKRCVEWLCGIVDPQDQQWVQSKLTPHTYKVVEGRLSFQKPSALGLPRTFIDCTHSVKEKHELIENGWNSISLPAAHDAMITAPKELTEFLIRIAD